MHVVMSVMARGGTDASLSTQLDAFSFHNAMSLLMLESLRTWQVALWGCTNMRESKEERGDGDVVVRSNE